MSCVYVEYFILQVVTRNPVTAGSIPMYGGVFHIYLLRGTAATDSLYYQKRCSIYTYKICDFNIRV